MLWLTKTRFLVLMVLFLFFQSCQDDDYEVVRPEVDVEDADLLQEKLVKITQQWFDENQEVETLFKSTRQKTSEKNKIEPQWQLANKSTIETGQDIIVVPVFKERALHNNVQLITFHQDEEVKLGFVLEIIPDSLYREEHDLNVEPDFQGRMKLYDVQGRLINIFTFQDGAAKNSRIGKKPDADIRGMSTLRTAGSEDEPIYDCSCVLKEVVVYASKPSSGSSTTGGYVYVTNPEPIFTSYPSGDLGGGAGGGSVGAHTFPVPITPVPTISSIRPQLTHLQNTLPSVRISRVVSAVNELINKNQLNSQEVLQIGHAIQSVYMRTVMWGYAGSADAPHSS